MSQPAQVCREPYRAFFPLGLIAALVGVMLWPAYFKGWTHTWPLEAHARLMVLGFGGCFIIGFLGTAGPRLLGCIPWGWFELLLHGIMAVVVIGLLLGNLIPTADFAVGLWLLGVILSMTYRLLVERKDVPPPGFPVAFLGLVVGSVSGFALSMESFHQFSPALHQLWRLLYFQAFPWLPILGVGPYLLPRFLGKKSEHAFAESLTVPEGWVRHFLRVLVFAVLFLGSLGLEAYGKVGAASAFRAVLVAMGVVVSIPGVMRFRGLHSLGRAVQVALVLGVLGWAVCAWMPLLRIAALHLMFIGSMALLIVAVATRVIWGHGGRHDLLAGKLRWMHWVSGLMVFAALTRFSAEFLPKIRISHYEYAAELFALLLIFWMGKLVMGLKKPKPLPPPGLKLEVPALRLLERRHRQAR
jgi:uncharacterized protein involved in response to NO